MIERRCAMLLTFALLAALTVAAKAESTRGAEAKIRKAWEEQTSLRARMRVSAIVQAGPNLLQVTGEGSLEFLRVGDQEKWRQSLTFSIPAPVGSESHHDALFDGTSLYLMNEMMGQREARAVPAEMSREIAPPGGAPLLEVLKKTLDLTLLREDTVADRPVYVLEGIPRAAQVEFTKGLFYIDQATGAQLRQEIFTDQNLAARIVVICEDLQTGVDIDPQRFVVGGEVGGEERLEESPAEAPASDEAPPQ